jgi:hypothetical protein
MGAHVAVAISNAQLRARLGWPLVLLTIAVYEPLGGWPRVALVVTGGFFLARTATETGRVAGRPQPGKPSTGPKTPKPAAGPKTPKPKRPARKPATVGAPADRPARPAPLTKVPRQRGADGRWLK